MTTPRRRRKKQASDNLRPSRGTELAAEYPFHVVYNWIGNTEMIAAKHYLQVTDDYYRLATREVGAAKPDAA